MVIVGHPLISFEKLYTIQEAKEAPKVPKDAICLFEYDESLVRTCKEKEMKFALHVRSEKEAILANAFGAFIVICSHELASKVQNLAEYYLFDTKVAIVIDSIKTLDVAIEKRVDMAILKEAIC